MTEKTLKKMMHYLCSNANYDKPNEIKEYIEDKEKKQGITQEEWQTIFEAFCRMGELKLQKWILNNKAQLMEDKEFAKKCLFIIIGHFEISLYNVKQMAERLSYLLNYIPDGIKEEILGIAFVTACEYNNIYLIKFLIEQNANMNFKYKDITGLDASKMYAESMEAYGDDTVYQYLLRNQSCDGKPEDVLMYYLPQTDMWGNHDGMAYETEATRKKKADEKRLDSKISRYRAECRAADYEFENLLDDSTSAATLEQALDYCNWGDGVELLYYIAMHKNCELAVALRIFYDGEGYLKFLDEEYYEEESDDSKWKCLIETVYSRIIEGCYSQKELHYTIPLDDEDKQELKRQGVPEIIWKDI